MVLWGLRLPEVRLNLHRSFIPFYKTMGHLLNCSTVLFSRKRPCFVGILKFRAAVHFLPRLEKMKKKIVMKVQMNCQECRTKALKTASIQGVSKVEIGGKEQEQIVVEAEGVCPANLACLMRKKVGHTEIISVEDVKPK